MNPQSVLIVEDSRMMRSNVKRALSRIRGIDEIYEAEDGNQALEVAREVKPDLVSLDLGLPGIHGIDVLKSLMRAGAPKVIVVSAMTTKAADITMECLDLGAIDVVSKPHVGRPPHLFELDLRRAFRAALQAGHRQSRTDTIQEPAQIIERPSPSKPEIRKLEVIIIASSTGGPRALHGFFSNITEAPRVPMVIVQHMPKGFTASMASRLSTLGPVNVREGEDGAELRAGEALVCAGDRHMTLTRNSIVYNDDAPVVGLRPRADITLSSAASVFGRGVLGIVFTGMGRDGLAGGAAIVAAGGRMWAQDAESSLVDGMPRAVRNASLTEFEGTPAEIAHQIRAVFTPAVTARRS